MILQHLQREMQNKLFTYISQEGGEQGRERERERADFVYFVDKSKGGEIGRAHV